LLLTVSPAFKIFIPSVNILIETITQLTFSQAI
jgi:hypothetical protein